jgi:hypothetical protein
MTMSEKTLTLEILSGPLDGHIVKLKEKTDWGKEGEGELIFPWDAELGTPQAQFFVEAGNWCLQGYKSPHGTYRLNREGRFEEEQIQLEAGDLLKASETWLQVSQIE